VKKGQLHVYYKYYQSYFIQCIIEASIGYLDMQNVDKQNLDMQNLDTQNLDMYNSLITK